MALVTAMITLERLVPRPALMARNLGLLILSGGLLILTLVLFGAW